MIVLSTIHGVWLRWLVFCIEKLDSLRKKLLVTGGVEASILLVIKILVFEFLVLVLGFPAFISASYPSEVLLRRGMSIIRFRAYRVIFLIMVSSVAVGSLFMLSFNWWNNKQLGHQILYTWSFADKKIASTLRYSATEIEVKDGVVSMLKAPYSYGSGSMCQAIFEMPKPFHFSKKDRLTGWSAVATAGNLSISFQLSVDNGITWYTWEKDAWRLVTRENATSFTVEQDVTHHINSLPYTKNGRDLIFRARLLSDCNKPNSVSSVSVAAQVPVSDNERMAEEHAENEYLGTIAFNPSPSLVAAVSSFPISDQIPVPENIRIVPNAKKRSLFVSGKAAAGAEVFVYFDIPYRVLYRTHAHVNGVWYITHDQNFYMLSPGSHAVYAKARDPRFSSISQSSEVVSFVVTDRQLPAFLLDLDTFSVCAMLVLLVGGTLVAVYIERKKT